MRFMFIFLLCCLPLSSLFADINVNKVCKGLGRAECWALADNLLDKKDIDSIGYLFLLHSKCDKNCYANNEISKRINSNKKFKVFDAAEEVCASLVEKDEESALIGTSCAASAYLTEEEDISKKRNLYKKSCHSAINSPDSATKTQWRGCGRYAEIEMSLGFKEKAKSYGDLACLKGAIRSCSILAQHHLKSGEFKLVMKYLRISRVHHNESCTKGNNKSCEALKTLASAEELIEELTL